MMIALRGGEIGHYIFSVFRVTRETRIILKEAGEFRNPKGSIYRHFLVYKIFIRISINSAGLLRHGLQ